MDNNIVKYFNKNISSLVLIGVICSAIFFFYTIPKNVSKCLELQIGQNKTDVLKVMGKPYLISGNDLYSYSSGYLSSCSVDLYFYKVNGVEKLRHKFCDSGQGKDICIE